MFGFWKRTTSRLDAVGRRGFAVSDEMTSVFEFRERKFQNRHSPEYSETTRELILRDHLDMLFRLHVAQHFEFSLLKKQSSIISETIDRVGKCLAELRHAGTSTEDGLGLVGWHRPATISLTLCMLHRAQSHFDQILADLSFVEFDETILEPESEEDIEHRVLFSIWIKSVGSSQDAIDFLAAHRKPTLARSILQDQHEQVSSILLKRCENRLADFRKGNDSPIFLMDPLDTLVYHFVNVDKETPDEHGVFDTTILSKTS